MTMFNVKSLETQIESDPVAHLEVKLNKIQTNDRLINHAIDTLFSPTWHHREVSKSSPHTGGGKLCDIPSLHHPNAPRCPHPLLASALACHCTPHNWPHQNWLRDENVGIGGGNRYNFTNQTIEKMQWWEGRAIYNFTEIMDGKSKTIYNWTGIMDGRRVIYNGTEVIDGRRTIYNATWIIDEMGAI